MGFKEKLLKIAGKDNFHMDDNISTAYILRLCWRYGWMMIRGRFFAIGRSNISSDIFVGKHVKAYEKKSLTIGSKVKLHDNVFIDALSARNGGGYCLATM